MKYFVSAIFALVVSVGVARADCPIGYSEFEEAIPHLDITSCPPKIGISAEQGFCRLVLSGDDAYVYGFIYTDDDACLSQVREVRLSDYLKK